MGFLNETEKQSHEVLCAAGSAKEMELCYHPRTLPSLWLQWGTMWSDFENRASLWTWPWSSSAKAWWEGKEKPSVLFPSSSPRPSLISSPAQGLNASQAPSSAVCHSEIQKHTHTSLHPDFTGFEEAGQKTSHQFMNKRLHPPPHCKSDNKKPLFRQGNSIIWGLRSMV